MGRSEWEEVADVFDALSSPARLEILSAVDSDRGMSEVAEDLDMTRSGVQRHLEVLQEHGLVFRSEEAERLYQVTPLGRFFVEFCAVFAPALSQLREDVDSVEDAAREEYGDLPVNEDTLERMVADRGAEAQKEHVALLIRDLQELEKRE